MKNPIGRLAACAAIAVLGLSTPALAQELGAEATYGEVTLNEGFTPDPYRVEVAAGGSIDAARSRGGTCVGRIARAPDLRLNYMGGGSPLNIKVVSDEDTTLVINGANGSWYCEDDSGGGVNPQFHRSRPESGVYEIWVGTYSDTPVSATIEISEMVR